MSQSDVTLVMRKAIHKVAIRLDYTPWLARLIKFDSYWTLVKPMRSSLP